METNQLNILLNKLLNSSTKFVDRIGANSSEIRFKINNFYIYVETVDKERGILNEESNPRYFNIFIDRLNIGYTFEDMSLKEFAILLEKFNDIINDFRYNEITNIISKIDNSSIHASNVDDIDV